MNNIENNYLTLAQEIIDSGVYKSDRTGVGTFSLFGKQLIVNLAEGFPLLTTKKMFFKGIKEELLWFLSGSTSIIPLLQKNVRIWSAWPYEKYVKEKKLSKEWFSMAEFEAQLLNGKIGPHHADLGPVYPKQWRNWTTYKDNGFGTFVKGTGVDQIAQAMDMLKNNPDSRRIIVNSWNVGEVEDMALPPCHSFFQFYTREIDGVRYLDMSMYQRSADLFLGVPFNIASYALLLHMFAQCLGYEVGNFIHNLGDVHIYSNHVEQMLKQIARRDTMYELPSIKLNAEIKIIDDFKSEDIEIINYEHHPSIQGDVAV